MCCSFSVIIRLEPIISQAPAAQAATFGWAAFQGIEFSRFLPFRKQVLGNSLNRGLFMNKKLIAAIAATTMAGAVGFASVAAAMEFNVYGSLRAGVYKKDTDNVNESNALDEDGNVINPTPAVTETTKSRDALDFGTGNAGNRFGIKGSEDLGNGLSAGFHLERGSDKADSFNRRHENVWLKGGWGKFTLGQQGNPYRNAANWDQSYWIGGNNRFGDGGSRINGIRYDSNFGGPFSFSLMATADDADGAKAASTIIVNDKNATRLRNAGTPAVAAVAIAPATVEELASISTVVHSAVKDEDGIDSFIVTAHYNIGGVATVNLGFRTNQQDSNEPGKSYDNSVISVNGVVGAFDWYVAYEENDDNYQTPGVLHGTSTADAGDTGQAYIANRFKAQDAETIGVFLSLNLGESNKIYVEYEDSSVDGRDANLGGLDQDAILFGYSHKFGPSTSFIVEYVSVDKESKFATDPDTLLAFLKVDF